MGSEMCIRDSRQSSLWISRKIINSGRWGEEPADASVTIYLIIAPSKIWQDGSSKLKVDGEFGKVGTVGSAQQKIWQDGPGSHKFWGKHGHVRLARGVRDRHARPRTRHVAGDCASSSPGIFTAPHARKPATRRRGPTPGCGSVPGRTRAVSACATRATRLPEPGSVPCPSSHISASSAAPPAIEAGRDASAGRGGGMRGGRAWPTRARKAIPQGHARAEPAAQVPWAAPQPMAVVRACWTDGRPARRPRGVQGARLSSRRGLRVAHGRWDGLTGPQAREAARGSALLGSFLGG